MLRLEANFTSYMAVQMFTVLPNKTTKPIKLLCCLSALLCNTLICCLFVKKKKKKLFYWQQTKPLLYVSQKVFVKFLTEEHLLKPPETTLLFWEHGHSPAIRSSWKWKAPHTGNIWNSLSSKYKKTFLRIFVDFLSLRYKI